MRACRQSLLFGARACVSLPAVLKQLDLKRPFIVTDSFIARSGMVQPIIKALDDATFAHQIFSEVCEAARPQRFVARLANTP